MLKIHKVPPVVFDFWKRARRQFEFDIVECSQNIKRPLENPTMEPFSGVTGVEGSECHSGRGFILGTLKGHTLGATTQGLLWKQDLKSRLKIPQRGEYVRIKISHVKLHKKIGVFHFGIKNKKYHQQFTKLKKITFLYMEVPLIRSRATKYCLLCNRNSFW